MEPKQISCDQSSWLLARYQSFIAQNVESNNQCGINEPWGRRIRACFHGWVILSNHSDNVLWSLWNPLTSKLIHLPPLIRNERNSYECCLSSPPDNQGSVFILLPEEIPSIVFCLLNRKRKRLKWTTMSYAKQLQNISGVDECFLHGLTCCNGKVYAMTLKPHYRCVIEMDIVVRGKEVVISLLPFVELPLTYVSFHTIYHFLKGSSTELFYIRVYVKYETRIDEVCLFKLDMTCMVWEEIEDFKDDILFLEFGIDNSCSVFYKSAVTSEIGGYVYILSKTEKLTSFYVKDRAISSMSCIARQSHVLVWAMIECGLEVYHETKQKEDKDAEIAVRPTNGGKTELDSTTSESHLLNIPFHILEMIMEHCVGVEYLNFRATCKRCYLAAPSIQWSNKTILGRLEMYSAVSPWLMMLDNRQGIITFIDPICADRYFIKKPQELDDDYKIYCCKFGWLLMYKYWGPMVFFNPFTRDIRELPETRYLDSLCFSAPPTSPSCMVVGFTGIMYFNVYIHFVSQEPTWRRYRLNIGCSDPYCFHFPTISGRDLYALCNNKRIEAISDVGEGDFSRVIVVDKASRSCCTSSTEYFLSNCDEHRLLVIVGEFGRSVEVFKLNDSTKEWEQIYGLGKYMIYISEASCICLKAKSPEMENKIYFPRLLNQEDIKIVFYSLETCKYHTFDDKNIQESFGVDLWKTKRYYAHAWIEPSWA